MIKQFDDIYRNKKILITGHTGFKGSWLTRWLIHLGANVIGLALDPDTSPNHWDILNCKIKEYRKDIRDLEGLLDIVESEKPEMIFHLAAQPLVRVSYDDPVETWSTNLNGTLNILESSRKCKSVRSLIVVTTDKVYQENNCSKGYKETDPIGGFDPYSASKAACEFAVDSYRKSFFTSSNTTLVATVRAGNVIGGGDWSKDRLIPDIIRSVEKKEILKIRSPEATRPWQHVLDCLSGYLLLGEKLLKGYNQCATAWNFGPSQKSNSTVRNVLKQFTTHFPELKWLDVSESKQPHEAPFLALNSEKACKELGWKPLWDLEQSINYTALWYNSFMKRGEVCSDEQLNSYFMDAAAANIR